MVSLPPPEEVSPCLLRPMLGIGLAIFHSRLLDPDTPVLYQSSCFRSAGDATTQFLLVPKCSFRGRWSPPGMIDHSGKPNFEQRPFSEDDVCRSHHLLDLFVYCWEDARLFMCCQAPERACLGRRPHTAAAHTATVPSLVSIAVAFRSSVGAALQNGSIRLIGSKLAIVCALRLAAS